MRRSAVVIAIHALLIVAVIVLVGVLGLIASLSRDVLGKSKFTGVLEQNVTLHILENDTAKEQGYLKALLDAFNAEYAQYGIKAVDANIDQYNDLEQSGPFGYGPDVLYQANDVLMKYVDGNHILPLPIEELDCYEYVSKSAWNVYEVKKAGQEGVYAVPVNIQQPLLFYRDDLLPDDWQTNWDDDKNGVPDMVEYWTDLYRFSKQIRQNSKGSKYGYMESLLDTYFSAGYLFSFGGYIFGGENRDDTYDIGFHKGDSYKGARIIRQLASVMNMECTEHTISSNRYSRMASGTYFATMTTPDVYTMFIREMVNAGYTQEYAVEHIKMVNVPKLPVSGDLEDESQGFMDMTVMGGVNGYAISSYTKYPNAALAFVDFATKYEMINKRVELLGISPARSDVVENLSELDKAISNNLNSGNIYVMPSIRATSSIWAPMETFFALIAGDILENKNQYATDAALKNGLAKASQDVYDAIHILAG